MVKAPTQKDSDSAPQKAGQEKADQNNVVFNKDITIHADAPLPQFDKGNIKAFRASGKSKFASNLIAYKCDKSISPRHLTISKYLKINHQSLVKLAGGEKVFWPLEGEEKFFFVYENTLGQPILTPKSESIALGWKQDDVMLSVAYPIIDLIREFYNKDMIHGEIWPGNIFYNGVAGADKVTLGECLSAPSAYNLPALYEPVERAMADPISRGMGQLSDDLYSFGVSLAVMLRQHDPMKGASVQEIIDSKIEKGSYATLLSKDRLSGATLELLRGLLYDDPAQRWTLEDLEAWKDGRRLSPKQSTKRVKAIRPIVLHDKKFVRPESLARKMTEYPDETARLIEGGDLSLWIERAIENKMIKVRFEQMSSEISSFDRTEGYNDRVSAAMATALYPEIPIHYRGINFIPDGFGKALTNAYIAKEKLQDYIDVMRSVFILSCIRMQKKPSATKLISKFDGCRNHLTNTKLGSGLERCLYLFDPECPCLSPILEKHYVSTPEEVIQAFEDICSTSNPASLFDRHIVAFLSVKDRQNIDPYLSELTAKEPHKRVLGQLRTLATIQKRGEGKDYPAIANWISKSLDEVYVRFHDSQKRQAIEKYVDKIKKKGDLKKIALLFDDPQIFQGDLGGFQDAVQTYKDLKKEKATLLEHIQNKKNYGQRSGEQVASVVSMVVSFVIIVASAYIMVMKG